ncbi:PEP-CTERM sorting domain-containing protein [bacterium]|nr:MAG: PEP-CTERM sorting domain-containing protein [bacterium]
MNRPTILALAAVLSAAAVAPAQTANGITAPQLVQWSGASQTVQSDFWNDVSGSANPGRGSFPGTGAWSAPIESNIGGDAKLSKVSNGTGGGPYAASQSIYFGGFSGDVNNNGGTLAVSDFTPVANLKTVVFQLQMGEAWTYDLWNGAAPVLSYNGGTQSLAATYSDVIAREFTGTVTMPSGEEPIYNNLRGYQWDLSGLSGITDFSISFTGVQHAQLYGLRLDQSDLAYGTPVGPLPQAVPEPASMIALSLGAVAFLRRRRKA